MKSALEMGYSAGRVLSRYIQDNDCDNELRIAFDIDGVLANDDSEKIYKASYKASDGNMKEYFQHEQQHAKEALPLGPIGSYYKRYLFSRSWKRER